jgi:NAD(P)-dependent dehydrogenase (short-subunit alcohol dehydrogenase family)
MGPDAFEGQHAVVTGGSRGIGLAIARALRGAGAHVTIFGRDRARLDAAVSDGAAHAAFSVDVGDPEAVAVAIREAEAKGGSVSLAVANAGAAASAPFAKTGPEVFRQMFDVNLLGVVNLAHAVLPGMVERNEGRIVAIASTAALKGYPYVSAYVSAKHAVLGLVRSLALEVASSGVTVNAICPGFTDTDIVAESLDRIVSKTGRTREQALTELTKHNPQKRLVDPGEVADAVLWLCRAQSRSVTGQAIAVAGGEV